MKICNAFLPKRKGLFNNALLIIALLCAIGATPLQAADLLTTKKIFQMPSYSTVSGKALKNVAVGYETYGTLNAKGDNAIFVAHFFSGTSHAAGKYSDSDKAAGYWDSIIGEGKAIDTSKFYVISADTLSNLNTKDPNVTTTGPSSLNPDSGKPYGMAFPIISYKDSVRVHKALLDQLGVKHLYAVAGASGGSIQAMEWAVIYPDFVDPRHSCHRPGLCHAVLDFGTARGLGGTHHRRSQLE